MNPILQRLFLSVLFLVPSSAFSGNEAVGDITDKAVDAAFSELERQIIEGYYGEKKTSRGEGEDEDRMERKSKRADRDEDEDDDTDRKGKKDKKDKKSKKDKKDKQKDLPPGIAKKLERGGQLPPGIAKRYLPEELESSLPETKEGYERVISDGKVLLVEAATGVIVDMIDTIGKKALPDRKEKGMEEMGKPARTMEKAAEPEKKWWQFWK